MCRFLSTNRRRIHKVALSHCDGTDFIIYGREHSERCHRKSKRTGSKRRSANSGGARSESRSSSAMRASARAQKPRSSGKSPASVPEAGGRLVPVSAMACASLLHGLCQSPPWVGLYLQQESTAAGAGSLREDAGGPPWPIPRARGRRERGSGSGNADQSGGGWGETVKSEWVRVTVRWAGGVKSPLPSVICHSTKYVFNFFLILC